MTPYTSVQVGIVGLGNIGHQHADRIVEHEADLVGGMDINPEARRHFSEKYGIPVFADANELFDAVDSVIIATPNRYHEEYAVAALEAGLDVFLEKPLAHSLKSARRIVATARNVDGFCMVGFKNRFATPVRMIKHLQRADHFGDIRHIEANYVRHRGIPGHGSWFTNRRISGGGSLIDIGVHVIDLSLHLLGFPDVLEVTATTRSEFSLPDGPSINGRDESSFDVDDSASAFIRCANDSTITLEIAWATNRSSNHTVMIGGTDAGACFDLNDHSLTLYETSHEGANSLMGTEDITPHPNDRISSEQEMFLRMVAQGESPDQNTVEEGLTVQRIANAIYRSSEEGCAIQLNREKRRSTSAKYDDDLL